jgi:TatD DNase family protein
LPGIVSLLGMMVDTHTHLNFKAFEDDWGEVVGRALAAGVETMIVVGTNLELSRRAVELGEQHPALFASVGIHPHHARQYITSGASLDTSATLENDKDEILKSIQDDIERVRELAKSERVVAIGEVGLDKHEYKNSKYQMSNVKNDFELLFELQKQLLTEQIELAVAVDKPLILHSREVGDEVLNEISKFKFQNSKLNGVFHCFEGSKKYVRKILDAGFYVSFTGNVTYSQGVGEVAAEVPLERLLLETDCPYMTPTPHRGKRNEPAHVELIARSHAKSRGMEFNDLVWQTRANARELFGL